MPVEALPGIVSPFIASVLDNAALVHEVADAFAGPVHCLDPNAMVRNIAMFRAAAPGVKIAFAKKANKASAFVDTAVAAGIGVDVASLPELEHALARGARELSLSGGHKSQALLERAVVAGVTIVCDSDDDLEHVAALAKRHGLRASVQLRFRPESQRDSRFGFAESNLAAVASIIDAARLDCHGLAFHCNGYDVHERVVAIESAVRHLAMLQAQGFAAHTINIGGGFTVRYREHGSVSQEPRDYHAGHVPSSVYPYTASDGPTMLRAIVERVKLTAGTRLMIEPGRALLDQAGLTAFRVLGTRERSGYGIVTVDGTSFSLSESWFGSEYLVDPLVIPREPRANEAWNGCIAGASCLESDMLAWRKIPFARKPHAGDLLVFVNTAGYQMDSNESELHGLPLPKKVVLSARPTGGLRWHLDGVRL
jgi:diaminopimelate decarboxylase